MTSARMWIAGARPRTLPLAIAPVLTACAPVVVAREARPAFAAGAALVALLLQIGVNYANDYSDGIRGTDAQRVRTGGPVRLVGQGLAQPSAVKRAAFGSFAAAAAVGLAVAAASGHWLVLVIGAASIPAAWFYTGGSRPYGYAGLGEVFVFLFFGLAAALGTNIVQTGDVHGATWWFGSAQGLLAAAVLMANNIRDIGTDVTHGKRTLAVRLGDQRARFAFVLMLALAAVFIGLGCALILPTPTAWFAPTLVTFGALPLARKVHQGAQGRDLVTVLAGTGRLALVTGVVVLTLAVAHS